MGASVCYVQFVELTLKVIDFLRTRVPVCHSQCFNMALMKGFFHVKEMWPPFDKSVKLVAFERLE